jgi:serine/threonine protein kinase
MIWEGDMILTVLRDISQGLLFLHKMKPPLTHGDLKSSNVLIDSCFRGRVADFGLSGGRRAGKKNLKAVGTPYWMAPELLRAESSNTSSSDVYAFGIVLWEIYARKDPYEGEDSEVVIDQICDPKINKRPVVPAAMTPLVASLMHDCLVANPEDRPTFDEVANRIKRFVIDDVHPVGLRRNDGRDADLLLKVFPRHIADALRDGRRVEPENHECITCFFRYVLRLFAFLPWSPDLTCNHLQHTATLSASQLYLDPLLHPRSRTCCTGYSPKWIPLLTSLECSKVCLADSVWLRYFPHFLYCMLI